MKVYQSSEIKNISIIGGSGVGKTTLSDSMLFESDIIKRRGQVESKNTVCDYFPVEHEYGYSVFSTVFQLEWMGRKLNFIDCPGADDFIGGAITALNVTDTALLVINSEWGVDVGTQSKFRYAQKFNKPIVFVLNQIDSEKADYESSVLRLKELYGSKVAIVQYPLSVGPDFNSLIDVLTMKMYRWGKDGGVPTILDIPESEKERAEELHQKLVESAAENDEALMEKFFEQGSLSEDEMRHGIHLGLIERSIFPIFCCSAKKDMGVRRLMEFLGNVVPLVSEMPHVRSVNGDDVSPITEGPTSIFVFKTTIEPHIGEISYFKVMSGRIHEGADLVNVTRGTKERLAQLFCVAGSNRNKVEELVAGDIGAVVKLKDTRTGNSLNQKGCEWQFDFIKYPEPKFSRAIRPLVESDTERLSELLTRMHEEDPTIMIEHSKELKQLIVHSQGEFHLKTLKWRLTNNDKMQVEFSEPRIPYRETITKASRSDYRHKKQSGGAGQFGEVHMIVEPYVEGVPVRDVYKFNGQEFKINARDTQELTLDWGGKLYFVNSIVGGAIDSRFIPAILKGVMDRMEQGPLTGSYARDVRVIVYDGKMHPVDSNEISFRLAGRNAFSQAFKSAGPKVLEPIYDVTVFVPSDKMGDVMSDLQGRRAVIMGMDSENGFEKILARVPLKEMYSYSTSLSSITGGRASFNMRFSSYELVNGDIQDKLLKEYESQQVAE